MRSDHRSRALAVDVEVAHVKIAHRAVDLVARLGVDGAGESELGVVGDFEGVVKALSFNHDEHRTEDFLLLEF